MLSRDVIGWRLLALTFIALIVATIPNLDYIESEWIDSIDSSNEVVEKPTDYVSEESYEPEETSNNSKENSSEEEFAIETAGDEDTSEPADDSSADSDDLSSERSALKTVSLEQPEWILPATQIIVLTMMAIMAVGLLTSTATAILASEGARFAILLAVMGPLLEKEGRVISWMDGRVRRFASSGVDQTRLQEIQNPVTGMQIAILQILSESGALGIHTGELRTKLETSRQLLSYHMKQLSERNFVKSSGRGRSIRWNLLDEGQEKLDNSTHLTNV